MELIRICKTSNKLVHVILNIDTSISKLQLYIDYGIIIFLNVQLLQIFDYSNFRVCMCIETMDVNKYSNVLYSIDVLLFLKFNLNTIDSIKRADLISA